MSNKILVIGAQNIDIFATSNNQFTLHDSSPGTITMDFGGVGRNIAANLSYLGCHVDFMTAFGMTYFSLLAQQALKEIPIHYSESVFSKEAKNSIYLGVMEQDDLLIGVNDMELISHIDVPFLQQKHHYISQFSTLVIDNNLPLQSLDYLIKTYSDKTLVMDAVSAHKVHKLVSCYPNIDILKCNHLEAMTLTNTTSIEDALSQLEASSTQLILITNQAEPIIVIHKQKRYYFSAPEVNDIIHASGAGDAFLSGFLSSYMLHGSVEQAIQTAKIAATITLQSSGSTTEKLKQMRNQNE